MITARHDGHSAEVEIYLEIEGARLSVSQVGPETLILRQPCSLPDVENAVLVIRVDGEETRDDITLPNGINENTKAVAFA